MARPHRPRCRARIRDELPEIQPLPRATADTRPTVGPSRRKYAQRFAGRRRSWSETAKSWQSIFPTVLPFQQVYMRTSSAVVLAAASAVVAIGCGTTKTSAPTPVPAGPSRTAPQQQPQVPSNPSDSSEAPAGGRGGRGAGGGATQAGTPNPQAYTRIVTAQAQTRSGL